jgi:hypothetical protein
VGDVVLGALQFLPAKIKLKRQENHLKKMNKSEKFLQRFRVSPMQLRDGHVFVLI